jgi:hypothetical protein
MFDFYAVIKESFLKHLWTIPRACNIYKYTSHEYADYMLHLLLNAYSITIKMYNKNLDVIISVILRCK